MNNLQSFLFTNFQRILTEILHSSTGKSLSEALIFASTNPQYDDRLFIESQVQNMKIQSSNMLCTEIVSDIQNNFCMYTTCSPHVLQKEKLLTRIYLYCHVEFLFKFFNKMVKKRDFLKNFNL